MNNVDIGRHTQCVNVYARATQLIYILVRDPIATRALHFRPQRAIFDESIVYIYLHHKFRTANLYRFVFNT